MRALAALLLCLATPALAQDPSFSGVRAFAMAEDVVNFGPRPSDTDEIRRLRKYILDHLAQDRIAVEQHSFTALTPIGPKKMVNLIAKIPGESQDLLLLAGHYDTKPFQDGTRFVGANDGGSSTAALLEAAHVLATSAKKKYTTWVIFHDGEESQAGPWTSDDSLHGSRRLAAKLDSEGMLKRVHALINIDMIGNKHLNMLQDENSTAWLNELVRTVAGKIGKSDSFSTDRTEIDDDHMPYLALHVPSVDLIDFTSMYTFWHKPTDTIDKLSAKSLDDLGAIVMATLDDLCTK
jgi:Zn-dependent M28 family amino/carboxypeptidase